MNNRKTDSLRTIGYINLVLAEYQQDLWPGEIASLQEALHALQRLAKK